MSDRPPPRPGTYILVMQLPQDTSLEIGRLGKCALAAGFYLYVGSAFGPGGLRARLAHHARLSPRPHWHVDYLRRHAALCETWLLADARHREHAWANWLATRPDLSQPLPGFGSSDCHCHSHLFRSVTRPRLADFRDGLSTHAAEVVCIMA